MIGTLDIKTRPLRLAYLVDPNNKSQVRKAIQLSSTLWGGDCFPILPLHKRMPATWREKSIKTPSAKSVILGYIDSFDPDILIQLSKEVPPYIIELGIQIIKPEEIWSVLDEDRNRHLSPRFGIGIFEILKDIFDDHFKFKAKYPIKIIFPKLPNKFSLFWASMFGEIPEKVYQHVKKYYFEPLEIKASNFETEHIKNLLKSDILFPRRIVQHKITNYRGRSSFGRDTCVYFLDASKTEDIIDFWNLRATGKTVLPIPKQFIDNDAFKEIVVDFLKTYRIPWPHNSQVCNKAFFIRARNCTMEEMQRYAKSLKIKKKLNDLSEDGFYTLQHWYPRIWDEWARDKDGAVPNDMYSEEEESIEVANIKELRFHSLLPKFAQKYGYHGEPRCANEISFRFYGSDNYIAEVYPKSSGEKFVRAISGKTSFRGDWRIGRNGLVKLVKDDFNENRDAPFAEKVFFAWLEDLGWKPKLSPSGMLAKQIFKKLEGYPSVLKNEKLLGLLEHMNGGSVKRDSSPVDKNIVNQERDLSVGEVKSKLGATADFHNDNLYGYLIEREIFKLGLRIQCQYCFRKSWYTLENIKDSFICPRCLNKFSAVGNLENSTWSYKTTGPFSVANYAEGAYSVLLTLDFFDDHKMTTLRLTPAVSFVAESPDKKKMEADFGAFWQDSIYGEKHEGLIFGECKTYNKFEKKDFDRMRYLAKMFPGAILVFSTLRKKLTSKEVIGITRIAKTGRKYWKSERPINPVLVLTGNELFHYSGPPYCWSNEIKDKFDRYLRGLISLCDVTQQIYLNLPSWNDEWHDKWENNRLRHTSKKKQDTKVNNEKK